MYHVVVHAIATHRDKITRLAKIEKSRIDISAEGKMVKQTNAWVSNARI